MSPVDLAIRSVNRALWSFHPGSISVMARAHYRRELAAWLFLPIMLGAVEGGVVGVLAKNAFDGAVDGRLLNLAVALLTSAPALANVTSFFWASVNQGRAKIPFMVSMQVATGLFIALVALAPISTSGLVVVVLAVIGARMCWSGVITIRSTVWRANYHRRERATLAGKLATVQAIILTLVGVAVGVAMNTDPNAFRVLYPAAAALGLVGCLFYRGMRVRGHRALVRAERHERQLAAAGPPGPVAIWRVLRSNRAFGQYMMCMFLFGTGNIMVTAPLVIMLRDRFGMDVLGGVLITSTIPTVLIPVTIPLWSRLLDRVHILRFRAVHCWAFVFSTAMFVLGAILHQPWLLYLGAAGKGVAYGGGVLGWNLGHLDFAPEHLASHYMGVHVTLTGVRGLFAPAVGVGLYELLEVWRPGGGPLMLLLCLALTLGGAFWFVAMARRMGRQPASPDR